LLYYNVYYVKMSYSAIASGFARASVSTAPRYRANAMKTLK